MIKEFDLILKDVSDPYARENFKRIGNFLLQFPLFRGDWRFYEITFTKAETNKQIPHGLDFKPTDIIQTSITGAGAITFNYSKFSKSIIDVTTTGACVVRCFIGAYRE